MVQDYEKESSRHSFANQNATSFAYLCKLTCFLFTPLPFKANSYFKPWFFFDFCNHFSNCFFILYLFCSVLFTQQNRMNQMQFPPLDGKTSSQDASNNHRRYWITKLSFFLICITVCMYFWLILRRKKNEFLIWSGSVFSNTDHGSNVCNTEVRELFCKAAVFN